MNLYQIPAQSDVRHKYGVPRTDRYELTVRARAPLNKTRQSHYRPDASLGIGSGDFEDSGKADETVTWRCPDCGAAVDLGDGDDVPGCCSRCGSTESGVLR